MPRKRIAIVLCIVATLSALAPVPHVKADHQILDLEVCEPHGRTPRLTGLNSTVTGNGYASGSHCDQVLEQLRVCLDYNGATILESCRNYTSPTGGDSWPYRCLPGVWDSMVIAFYKDGTSEVDHSSGGQSLPLIVTSQCRIQ